MPAAREAADQFPQVTPGTAARRWRWPATARSAPGAVQPGAVGRVAEVSIERCRGSGGQRYPGPSGCPREPQWDCHCSASGSSSPLSINDLPDRSRIHHEIWARPTSTWPLTMGRPRRPASAYWLISLVLALTWFLQGCDDGALGRDAFRPCGDAG
jgi:hypothetical protein